MTFSLQIERINLKILEGELNAAELDLNTLITQSQIEQRIQGHFRGILMFARGQFTEAKQQFEATRAAFGDNVALLRDLVSCQYHLHDMNGFRGNLGRLEKALIENHSKLSPRTRLECELMVGKFLEEEARLAPAMDFFERALTHAASAPQKLRALIQKARWTALYQPNEDLSELYRTLISAPRAGMTADLVIELEHSLMLIELRLIGADHAWQRVLRLGQNISEIDQRLLLFDFIEGVLNREAEVAPAVVEKLNDFKDLDPYEKYLSKIVQGTLEPGTKIQGLALLAAELPWASYLRLLCLSANLESTSASRLELHRKIQLIIRALDARSQSLWNSRLKQALESPEIRVEYSARKRAVTIQGRSVDLSKKKMGMQLLEGLARKPELSVDEAISLLWQQSFTPEHYHRLRMGIHRLNTLINKVTGLGKIIEVDSQAVRLRPEVKIRSSDSLFIPEIMNL